MATRYEVIITDGAWADYLEILSNIADISRSGRSVEKWAKELAGKIFGLEIMPEAGSLFEFDERCRTVKVGRYRVIYEVNKERRTVSVYRIVYARRDFGGMTIRPEA